MEVRVQHPHRSLYLRVITPLLTEYEAWWAPEPVWTSCRREISIAFAWIWTSNRSVRSQSVHSMRYYYLSCFPVREIGHCVVYVDRRVVSFVSWCQICAFSVSYFVLNLAADWPSQPSTGKCAQMHMSKFDALVVAIKQQACSGISRFVDARGEQAQWPPQ